MIDKYGNRFRYNFQFTWRDGIKINRFIYADTIDEAEKVRNAWYPTYTLGSWQLLTITK